MVGVTELAAAPMTYQGGERVLEIAGLWLTFRRCQLIERPGSGRGLTGCGCRGQLLSLSHAGDQSWGHVSPKSPRVTPTALQLVFLQDCPVRLTHRHPASATSNSVDLLCVPHWAGPPHEPYAA